MGVWPAASLRLCRAGVGRNCSPAFVVAHASATAAARGPTSRTPGDIWRRRRSRLRGDVRASAWRAPPRPAGLGRLRVRPGWRSSPCTQRTVQPPRRPRRVGPPVDVVHPPRLVGPHSRLLGLPRGSPTSWNECQCAWRAPRGLAWLQSRCVPRNPLPTLPGSALPVRGPGALGAPRGRPCPARRASGRRNCGRPPGARGLPSPARHPSGRRNCGRPPGLLGFSGGLHEFLDCRFALVRRQSPVFFFAGPRFGPALLVPFCFSLRRPPALQGGEAAHGEVAAFRVLAAEHPLVHLQQLLPHRIQGR